MRILAVEARFYTEIADELYAGAEEAAQAAGIHLDRVSVPGALEIPAVIAMAEAGDKIAYDGYIALGCVIRGETTHYDYVCGESARALQDLAIWEGMAIGNGILTVENRDQAMARARRDQKNKGRDALEAAVAVARLRAQFFSEDSVE